VPVDEGTEDQEVFVFLLEFDQVPCAVPLLARPGWSGRPPIPRWIRSWPAGPGSVSSTLTWTVSGAPWANCSDSLRA